MEVDPDVLSFHRGLLLFERLFWKTRVFTDSDSRGAEAPLLHGIRYVVADVGPPDVMRATASAAVGLLFDLSRRSSARDRRTVRDLAVSALRRR
jgi:hypothetical protein